MTTDPALDLITIGRSSVDLYGQQIGGRLEDMGTFAKSVGGSPTNTAIGAARLGLRAGLITGVGDEPMGRFIREQLVREGVDVRGVRTDPRRLTALVLLGVRDEKSFPLVFYRENCADMAVTDADVDEAHIAAARAVCISGTHLSTASTYAMTMKAVRAAREAGRRVAWDIDYRPNLWDLAGHGAGEERYIRSDTVTAHLQTVAPHCDLIVGTEEEFHILGGTQETLGALRAVRALSDALLVCKRGPMGCVAFSDAIPDSLDAGVAGPGFPVEVYNVLGAGDAFMAGFLRGWLRDEPLETACTYANACGAFAVSRLLCSPEYPTWTELRHFMEHGAASRALRRDPALAHIHHATTRRPGPASLHAFAIDHRVQLEAIADAAGAPRERIERFKQLAVRAAAGVARGREGFGLLLDSDYGRPAMSDALAHGLWIARPVEQPGSRPLELVARDIGSHLVEWPVTQVVKVLCFYRSDDPPDLRERQDATLLSVHEACRATGRELLVEIIAGKHGPISASTVADVLAHLYALGLKPDWWKLEPQTSPAAWQAIEAVVAREDPFCRGIVMLGLEAPEAQLREAFAAAAGVGLVRGFAVGRTLFAAAAGAWLAGRIDDETAVADMAERFARLCAAWDETVGRRRAA